MTPPPKTESIFAFQMELKLFIMEACAETRLFD
jgi:hypothetical protein